MNNTDLTFGRRFGFEPLPLPLQDKYMTDEWRTELYNIFHLAIYGSYLESLEHQKKDYETFFKGIWMLYFKKPIDEYQGGFQIQTWVKSHILKAEWYKVYEFYEFIFSLLKATELNNFKNRSLIIAEAAIDRILIEYKSGYRLFERKFIPITNETEIEELTKTNQLAKSYNLWGVEEHLKTGLELLSRKENPDYRLSIKESISMVEVIGRIIEPDADTLGKALKKIGKREIVPESLKQAFEKLYGYTCGEEGIRHGLMSEQKLDIEEARFFLVACSAFTNYLIEKARKDNLLNPSSNNLK